MSDMSVDAVEIDLRSIVEGTLMSIPEISARTDIDEGDVEEALLDVNLELCEDCGWWTDCGELAYNLDEAGSAVCDQCAGPARG